MGYVYFGTSEVFEGQADHCEGWRGDSVILVSRLFCFSARMEPTIINVHHGMNTRSASVQHTGYTESKMISETS